MYASKSMAFIVLRLLIQDCMCTEVLGNVSPTSYDPKHVLRNKWLGHTRKILFNGVCRRRAGSAQNWFCADASTFSLKNKMVADVSFGSGE